MESVSRWKFDVLAGWQLGDRFRGNLRRESWRERKGELSIKFSGNKGTSFCTEKFYVLGTRIYMYYELCIMNYEYMYYEYHFILSTKVVFSLPDIFPVFSLLAYLQSSSRQDQIHSCHRYTCTVASTEEHETAQRCKCLDLCKTGWPRILCSFET